MTSSNRSDSSIKIILLYGLIITSAIIAVYLISPSFITFLNYKTTDALMTFSKRPPSSGSIIIVDIDEKSLAKYGQWPWPRYRLAHLLQKIDTLGAASIGIDMILAEPDRTSPQNWQASTGKDLGYQIDLSNIPPEFLDHDRYLADTLAKGPFVLSYTFLMNQSSEAIALRRLQPVNVVRITRSDSDSFKTQFFIAQGIVCNLPVLSEAVSYSGFLNATPDSDGILRRIPMLIEFGDQLYPSIALATLMQLKKADQIYMRQEKSGSISLIINDIIIPVDQQGNMSVNFGGGSESFQRFSAADVLDGMVKNQDAFKDKIILLGSSASGLGQTYQTPRAPVDTHLDIYAQLLETALAGNAIIRPQEFLLWEALIGIFTAALLCMAVAGMEILGSAVIGGVCMVIVWAGMWQIFRINGFLFSPLLPSLLILVNYAVLTILKTTRSRNLARKDEHNALILLKSSENRLNSIIKTIPDIVFRVDPSGCITFISPAVSRFIGEHEDLLLGRSIFDMIAPDDREKAMHRLNERRTGERATRDLELRAFFPRNPGNGAEDAGYFSLSAQGIYEDNHSGGRDYIGAQGILRDISEQKKLETQLFHAQKMKAVGDLAAGVAHDLNNILTGLVSYPDLLLMELPKDSPLRRKVSIIQQSGQKAAAIVQDLLTLARSGVQNKDIINLNTVISEYLESPEYMENKNRRPLIKLETRLDPDLMNIKGSPFHLSKVLMNLLNNSLEAMHAGGCIRISTVNKYLDAPLRVYEDIPEGEYVCLCVADEGVGINSEDLKRIFEPFYTKKKMQRSGTGLGTTVIWTTVKEHGGYIDLMSRESEGTRIEVYLPATREAADSKSHKVTLEDYLGTEHILIVDDMSTQIEIASRMLAKLGYRVSSVSSGEAAVDFIKENKPDILVLDMIMPGGIDGYETYNRIISIRPDQKAIITSGYSESERVKMLQKMGVGAYVQKPYTMEAIGIAVRKELDR